MEKRILFFILFISLCVKINLARDRYMHEWDERYHALVAKNMLSNPLRPTLIANPQFEYDHTDWTLNHIWLSKPPVPLWFMAISLKIFGFTEWAIRIPGVIFAQLIVILCYLIGREMKSKSVGLWMAGFMGLHGMLSDLASGRLSSDGVETCFLFFVFLGCWMIVSRSERLQGASGYLWIGVVAGIALLCKWQPALLVIVILFIYRMPNQNVRRHVLLTASSFLVAMAICSLWIGYCLWRYPVEMQWMLRALFTPFVDKTVNVDGQWYSYLRDYGHLFGYGAFGIIGIFIWQWASHKRMKELALWIWMLLPLLIFSLAEVKRGTYLFISAPAVFYAIGWALCQPLEFASKRSLLLRGLSVVSVIMIVGYSVEKMYLFRERVLTKEWCEEIKNSQPADGAVIYNDPHYIEWMFYHEVTAYPFAPPASH